MKAITKMSLVYVLFIFGMTAYSQNCNFYFPLEENKGVVYENYDNAGNLQGSQEMKVKKVTSHSDHVEASLSSKQYDSNNHLIHQGEFGVKCIGNKIVIDIKSILDPNMIEGFEGMEILMENDDIVIPADLSTGQQLPDARVYMKVSAGGMLVTELTFTLKNRNVLSKEKVNVPAGNFDTFKISYDFILETKAMGMESKMVFKNIEYHSANIGMIKSQTYDDQDKIISSTLLSKIL